MHYYWPREPQGRELENLTQLFKILGDPSCMRVLFQIGPAEACVSEVADKLNMSESAISHPPLEPSIWESREVCGSCMMKTGAAPSDCMTCETLRLLQCCKNI